MLSTCPFFLFVLLFMTESLNSTLRGEKELPAALAKLVNSFHVLLQEEQGES